MRRFLLLLFLSILFNVPAYAARDFDGVDDQGSCGTGDLVGAGGPWSVAAWVHPDALTQNHTIVGKRDSFTVGGNQFQMNLASSGVLTITKDASFFNFSTLVISTGVWTFVGIRADATSAIAYEGTTSQTETADWSSGSSTDQTIGIGRLITEASEEFDGPLAEIAVWNVKITDNEMLAMANGAPFTTIRSNSLVAHWPLWGTASPEADLSGSLHNCTITGATVADHAPVGPYIRR